MLRVSAPVIPAIGVGVAGFQTDHEALAGPGIDVAVGQRRLKDHGLFEKVVEAHAAILLPDRHQVPPGAAQVHVVAPERGRRKHLHGIVDPGAGDLSLPVGTSVFRIDGVQITPLRVQHLALAVSGARALVGRKLDQEQTMANAFVVIQFPYAYYS